MGKDNKIGGKKMWVKQCHKHHKPPMTVFFLPIKKVKLVDGGDLQAPSCSGFRTRRRRPQANLVEPLWL